MRAAPPCTVVLADGCTERRWIVALHGLAGATLALWAAIWADLSPATTAALVGVGALVTAWLGAGSGTRPLVRYAAAPMALHWSGTVWHLLPGPDAAPDVATVLDAVSPAIDTGPWLLLRARRDDAPDRWLVADARLTPPADWAALGDDDDETYRPSRELSDGETPEAVLASKEIAQTVNAAIEALSEDLRQAITLREIEGLSYEEIAELMNCPIGTVRSRIFRAREAIAQRLRPLLDTREGERW